MPTPLSQLLTELFLGGFLIREEGGVLRVGPKHKLTGELSESIRAHRDTILSYLVGCPRCREHLDGLGRCPACPYRCCTVCGKDTGNPAWPMCPVHTGDGTPGPEAPSISTEKPRLWGKKMRVTCAVEDVELEGDHEDAHGDPVMVLGVCATCLRCDHQTESWGRSGRSVRRCLVLMREECPQGEENYYVVDDSEVREE